MYRPFLEYARDNGIALVALNAPSELVSQVSDDGIDGLPGEEVWMELERVWNSGKKVRLAAVIELI